jgi:hypothetical protein
MLNFVIWTIGLAILAVLFLCNFALILALPDKWMAAKSILAYLSLLCWAIVLAKLLL